jgi:hypothetical protein
VNRLLFPTLFCFLFGCNVDLVVAGNPDGSPPDGDRPDAGADAGFDAGADAGPPFCDLGTARCNGGMRETCVNLGGAAAWQPAPCRARTLCAGDGECRTATGADLSPLASAPAFTHPDVGITGESDRSLGADRFPPGLYLANPLSSPLSIRVTSGDGMPTAFGLAPGDGTLGLLGWSTYSQVPERDETRASPSTMWEPAYGGTFAEEEIGGLLFAAWSLSPGSPLSSIDPFCAGGSPPARCIARSFEGTIATGGEGTRFVISAEPATSYFDRCRGEIVTDGLPFVGISTTGGTNGVRVRLSAGTLGAAMPPTVPIMEAEPPVAMRAGELLESTIYRGGVLQLVVAPPATEEECMPVASTGCLERCSNPALDFTGTTIETDFPAVVTAGHTCARRSDGEPCSYLTERVSPIAALGTEYAIPGPAAYESGPIWIDVVAAADATVTYGGSSRALAAGEGFEIEAADDVRLESTSPVLVTRLSRRAGGSLAITSILPVASWASRHAVFALDGARAIVVTETGATITSAGAPVAGMRRAFDGDATREIVEVDLAAGARVHVLETSAPSEIFAVIAPDGVGAFAITRGARL